jgi:hypothetical protein
MTAFDDVIAAMTVDDLVAVLESIDDRAELIAFLTPLRLPTGLPEFERARLTAALMAAASRVWKGRLPARAGEGRAALSRKLEGEMSTKDDNLRCVFLKFPEAPSLCGWWHFCDCERCRKEPAHLGSIQVATPSGSSRPQDVGQRQGPGAGARFVRGRPPRTNR